jgi:phage tail tape-measure protein
MAGIRIPVDTKDGVRNLDSLSKGFKKAGNASKRSEAQMKGLKSGVTRLGKGLAKLGLAATGVTALLSALGGVISAKLGKSFLTAATTTEGFQLRLQTLLGSVSEGNRMFREMAEFAGQVPFEFEQIMESATNLSGIMTGGVEEVRQWMPLIADLAAATGLGISKTTEQIQRMLSAGAASADLFREKGVLAMLGFQAGVSVSAEETRKRLMEAWKDPESKFAGATDAMAASWEGMMSMISDAWFAFRNAVMEAGVFDFMKAGLKTVLDLINQLRSDGRLAEWANQIGKAVVNGFGQMIEAVGLAIDVFNQLRKIWIGLKQTWSVLVGSLAKGYQLILEGNIQIAKGMKLVGMATQEDIDSISEAAAAAKEFADFQFDTVDELQAKFEKVDPWGTWDQRARAFKETILDTTSAMKKQRAEAEKAGTGFVKPKLEKVDPAKLKIREQFDTAFDQATLTPYQLEMKNLDELLVKYQEAGIEKARIDEWYSVQRDEILARESDRSIAEHERMIEEMSKGYQSLQDDIVALSETIDNRFVDGMTDGIMAFITGTKSAKQAMSEFATQFAIDVTKMIIKQTILNALQSSMGGSGIWGGMINAGIGAMRANGGPVTAGKPYIVGERQPETFVSSQGRRQVVGKNGPEQFIPRESGRIDKSAEQAAPKVTIANILDPGMMNEWANSSEGQDAIINVMANNQE